MAKVRISKKLYSELPTAVAEAIADKAAEYHIKSATVTVEPRWSLYAGEGQDITVIRNNEKVNVKMVSEAIIGASDVSYEIGYNRPLPEGTWVVTVSYYAGYLMSVVNVALPAIAA